MKTLLASSWLAAFAIAQDPAADVATALLRRDAAAAASAAASAATPALRARLQAALLPASERAAAMLAVARAFPADPEADRALVAGAAAVLAGCRREQAVPELDVWNAVTDDDDFDADGLAPVVLGLREVVAARRTAGGDAALLQDAEAMLSLACVSRFGLWPARVPVGSTWQRPAQLAEPLQLRLLPCGPGYLPWHELDSLGAPLWTATLPVAGPFELPQMPPGDWLLEVTSTKSPWRGVRRVLVSDLEAVALSQDGHLAIAAFDARGPTAARWELWRGGSASERGELGAAPALVRLDASTLARDGACELRLRGEQGTAWIAHDRGVGVESDELVRWLVHGMVDRPIYRPGETMQGRVVLRRCRWDGEGLARVPTTAPAADQAAQLIVRLGAPGERVLALRTDANGVAPFSFIVPAEVEPGWEIGFAVELPEKDKDGEPLRRWAGDLCSVANYRRQAVQLDVDGPSEVAADTTSVDVVARAEWASGGPAAGLDVKAAINANDDREEALALRTDADGRAIVRVPVASLGAGWIHVEFTVTGPDGRAAQQRHRIEVARPAAAVAPPEATDTAVIEVGQGYARFFSQREARAVVDIELGDAVVGEPCRITLRGERGQDVLLVVGRSSNARVRTVRLADDGVATVDEPVLRCDWPRFDVSAATRAGCTDQDVPVRLRPMREAVLDVPEQAAAGASVTLRAHTGVPGALVTIAVVDERIYELASDATREPDEALRPWLPDPDWDDFNGWRSSTPVELLASLLEHGRLPPLGWTLDESVRLGGPAYGHAGPAGPTGEVRSRFSSTAHFETIVADAQGTATTSFRMPGDLTRWRATAVVIGPDGEGTIARKSFASRQPLAAEPVLPRALREGDTFALPLSIDRAADATAAGDGATVTTAVTGAALAVDRAETDVVVPAGRVVATTVPLRAVHAGEAKLQLAAQLGEHNDRSERAIAVAADRIARPLTAAASGTGEVTIPLPEGASPDAGLTVDVLQGGAEAWRLLEQDLANYPYGCAEQTLSRLVPYFALARAAKMRGDAPPQMDEAFGKRLRGGLARLRELQTTSSRGFAFWPDQEADRGFTGLVLHGLAMLRDGGFDLAKSGLDLSDYRFRDELPRPDGVTVVDAAFLAAAEQLAGELRLYPKDNYARRLLRPAVEVLPQLPAGLCARLGLALHGAGDHTAARACRERLQNAALPALTPDRFPGEDPLAVMALRLELDVALQAPAAECERAAAELLLAGLRGGSTYGRSCALAALALVLPRTEAAPGSVVVAAGGERRELAIGGEAGAAVRCALPRAAAVTVRGPAGMPLLVRVVAQRAERASDHPAWASPVRVERQWCTVRADATYEDRRDGRDLVPLAGAPLVGRPLVLRLVVQSPVPMRHVVVDCPLPAGFELPGEPKGIERFDDRVAFACNLDPRWPTVLRLDVVPTVAGRFVWPPATAAPMYVSGNDGGAAGTFVDVAAVPPGAVPSLATCLTGPRPAKLDEPPDPFEDLCDELEDLLEEDPIDGVDEAARQRAADTKLGELAQLKADPWHALGLTTQLIRHVDSSDGWLLAEHAWRFAAVVRLRAALVDRTIAALEVPWSADREVAQRGAQMLLEALAEWPADSAREPWISRWWPKARAVGIAPDDLLGLLSREPEDPALCTALRELVATGKRQQARGAWALLSAEQRQMLSPTVVLDKLGADHEGIIAWLTASDAGRAELRSRLRTPEFMRRTFAELQSTLPGPLWADVPLAAYEAIAVVAASNEDRSTLADVATRLAAAPAAAGELQRAFVAAKTPAWRFLLALTLRSRGLAAGETAAAANDPELQAWVRALALAPGDVAGAMALMQAQRARPQGVDLAGNTDLLGRFLSPILAAAASPDELYAAREWFDAEHWRAAWTRLSSRDRVVLLGCFRKNIDDEFVPATAEEAEALWQFVQRTGDVDGPLEALLRSPAGTDCLRKHLAAGDAGPHAEELRSELAKTFSLDGTTLAPLPGEELRSLLVRIAHFGIAGERHEAERKMLHRVRLLRGV